MALNNAELHKWCVLFVKSRQELKIKTRLEKLGLDIEVFCPTRIEYRQWSDRKKKMIMPLLPSILLVRLKEADRNSVFSVPNTLRYLFENKKPAVVKEHEIERLRTIAENKNIIAHETAQFIIGDEIDLTPYGFENLMGIVKKSSNTLIWVSLERLGFMLKLTLK